MRWFTIFSLRYALLESPSDERRFPRQPQLPNTSKIGDNHCYHADMAAVCDSNHRAVAPCSGFTQFARQGSGTPRFVQALATASLRFANVSIPSGCKQDFQIRLGTRKKAGALSLRLLDS